MAACDIIAFVNNDDVDGSGWIVICLKFTPGGPITCTASV
jgi:hypothetical protein